MIEIKLPNMKPDAMMGIVKELRAKGYVQGTDFDFAYHKPEYDLERYGVLYDRYTLFTFYKEELASWFELLYK
jgi:hypothetical protein